jgi:hypothetical protein
MPQEVGNSDGEESDQQMLTKALDEIQVNVNDPQLESKLTPELESLKERITNMSSNVKVSRVSIFNSLLSFII